MRRLLMVFTLSIGFLSPSLPAAHAEIISFPCGAGGTYSVESSNRTITKSSGCTGSLIIDSSVLQIGTTAFYSSNLTSVVIPNSVTSIGGAAFKYSFSLTTVIIGSSVTEIGSSAFSGANLRTIAIPDSVLTIGSYAFLGDDLLTSVTFGKSLIEIGSGAFVGTKLTVVNLPDSVTKIGTGAFSSINTLTSIIYCGPAKDLETSPTCPPERKAVLDAAAKAAADKAAADKVIADAKAAAEAKVAADKAAADRAAADAQAAIDRAATEKKAEADRAAVQAAQDAKKLTIICKKGSATKKVTGESPVCPSGYTNSLAKFLTFQAFSKCKLYKKDSSLAGIALLDNGMTLKFSYAGKYSSFMASAASYQDVACTLSVMKAPSFVTSQIDTTRALDGLQKASWGKVTSFWTYHPDNGLNISFNTL